MKKIIKKTIKRLINFYGWKLTKIYKNKSYTNQKPNLKLLQSLHAAKGILHMGGHRGSEAPIYDWLHKKTLWIEANPKIFIDLKNYISTFINQKAFNELVYNIDGEKLKFKISNNDGASSSIYDFGYESIKQNLKMIETISLVSKKIDTFFLENKINSKEYDFWIMDLQGAELLALKGAQNSLKNCNFIYVEVSKGEHYKKAAQWNELSEYLKKFDFENLWEPESIHTDVLFKKKNFNL